MSSGYRKRSLLLTLCTFITLLLMSGSAAISTHARTSALLHGMAQRTIAAVMIDTHTAGERTQWQQVPQDDSSGAGFVLVDDVDDELVLPAPVRIALNYLPSLTPLGAIASFHPVPVASLLRPPSLA
jgi:hypothetical protein